MKTIKVEFLRNSISIAFSGHKTLPKKTSCSNSHHITRSPLAPSLLCKIASICDGIIAALTWINSPATCSTWLTCSLHLSYAVVEIDAFMPWNSLLFYFPVSKTAALQPWPEICITSNTEWMAVMDISLKWALYDAIWKFVRDFLMLDVNNAEKQGLKRILSKFPCSRNLLAAPRLQSLGAEPVWPPGSLFA